MSRLTRFLLGLFLFLFFTTFITYSSVQHLIRAPYPQTDGTLPLPGLQAEVTVYRDEFGVPHIYAQNEHDLYLAQGYIQAQDRFWQMEFWRHIGQGRISEIVGEPGVESDKFIRTVGWNRIAEATAAYYQTNAPEDYAILEAYSQGVNLYITQNQGQLAVSDSILRLVNEPWPLEPWQPVHSLAWAVVMSHDLGGNYEDELLWLEMAQALGEENVAQFFPPYPADRPVIVPTETGASTPLTPLSFAQWSNVSTQLVAIPPENGFIFGHDAGIGSNNWVVSGAHTNTGQPLLADDPHLSVQMPAIWYEMGLHMPNLDVVGVSFAGVPGIIVGHNNHIAWGVTNVGPDVQDLFMEKLNPADPNQYEFEGEWRPLTTIEEIIKVNGGEDVKITVRATHHGPLMTEIFGEDAPADFVLSLQWASAGPTTLLRSVNLLNRAQNFEQFQHALSFWDTAGQNIVYADVEGNIGYQATGRIPIRQAGQGLFPVPGWTGEYEWVGWVPFEEMPSRYNPPEGFIVTANNAPVDSNYPYFLGYGWADGDRAQRITNLISGKIANGGQISAADFAQIHMDSYSMLAEKYVPLLAGLSSSDPAVQTALDLLQKWDYQATTETPAASVFNLFLWHLQPLLLGDELGQAAESYIGGHAYARILLSQAADPAHPFWDNITTPAAETQPEILLQALTQTGQWLTEKYGSDPAGWHWGNLHQMTLESAPLGESGIEVIENLVNRGPYPTSGDRSAVNAVSWSWGNPAEVTNYPSMRIIIDLSNFDQSQVVIPSGQSGHPGHPHYDNQIPLWLTGQYHPLWFSEAAVQENAAAVLVLVRE